MTKLQGRPFYAEAKSLYNESETREVIEAIRIGLQLKSFIRRSVKTLAFGGQQQPPSGAPYARSQKTPKNYSRSK